MRGVARIGLAAGSTALLLVGGIAVGPVQVHAAGVTTFAALESAFAAGGTVQLAADVSNSGGANLTVGSSAVTLDLDGHSLTINNVSTDDAGISVMDSADLTIEDSHPDATNLLTVTGSANGAGIGGNSGRNGGTITIASGRVSASGTFGAGIGGGAGGHAGGLTVSGGSVTASSANAAGIGGGIGDGGGVLTVSGGAVKATGGEQSAGIGGSGLEQGGGADDFDGGAVTAIGGADGGAGVGGGAYGEGGAVSVNGGTLTATGTAGGAGVGGGKDGAGGALTVASGGLLTATDGGSGASAVGAGAGGSPFGAFTIAGTLEIPQDATLDVTGATDMSGSSPEAGISTGGVVDLLGSLTGVGTLVNDGTILPGTAGSVDTDPGTGVTITDNDYIMGYDANGGTVVKSPPNSVYDLQVYAATVAAAHLFLPIVRPPGHATFVGWYTAMTGGKRVTNTSSLNQIFGPGPLSTGLYAVYGPRITARVTSTHSKTHYGWYRGKVRVDFTCSAGPAALASGCPAAVTVSKNTRGRKITRTVTDKAGHSNSATVVVKLDRTKPKIRLSGVKNGHTYSSPRHITCHAKDALSGLARRCAVTAHRHGHVVRYEAKASDRAGNVRRVKGSYQIR